MDRVCWRAKHKKDKCVCNANDLHIWEISELLLYSIIATKKKELWEFGGEILIETVRRVVAWNGI